MSYSFQPNRMYRMPTHFGPATGPRQGADGRKFECKDTPKTTSVAVSFVSEREQLEVVLPEHFSVAGEPIVTVHASYMTEIELLPVGHSNRVIHERWVGEGVVRFHPARWEDMPTQYNIGNTLQALTIKEYRGASITKSVGGEDLSAQRILH